MREFQPARSGTASIYVCGATVQGVPHIGHIRGALNYDVLRRWLVHSGLDVLLVRNVTDIDDKILTKAAAADRPWWEWAATHERAFEQAYEQLGCLPPSINPRATGHVTQMVELMQRLIDQGHAYAVDGDVYFSVKSFDDYGKLSGQVLEDVQQGETAGPRQAGPARLHAVEVREAGRAVVADAVGRRPAGLAPGVLGDGHGLPRRGVRHPRRRARPGLPAPRKRARAVERHAATRSPATGCTTTG